MNPIMSSMRKIRTERCPGVLVKDVAQILKITPQGWSMKERGDRRIAPGEMELLAAYFDIPIAELNRAHVEDLKARTHK